MRLDTDYILVPKNTINAYELSKEHTLTPEEAAKITVNSKLLKKFIQQKAIAIQFDIGNGLWQDKTELGLQVVKALNEIADDIGGIKEQFESYVHKKREEEALEAEKNKK